MNIAAVQEENARLKALLEETQAALAQSEEARRRLEGIVGELRREKFGAQSEKLSPEQYNLPLEDVEIAQGVLDAAQEKAEAIIKGQSSARSAPRQRNRGQLPAHLERVERIIADSDEVARAFRFQVAHHSELKSPAFPGAADVLFPVTASGVGQSRIAALSLVRRMLSPVSSMRCALCTILSRMASA